MGIVPGGVYLALLGQQERVVSPALYVCYLLHQEVLALFLAAEVHLHLHGCVAVDQVS